MNPSKFGLFFLKPDGYERKGARRAILAALRDRGLRIVRRKRVQITIEAMRYQPNVDLSTFAGKQMFEILSRRKVSVCLVAGDDASRKLYELKREVRTQFRVPITFDGVNPVENIIHAADPEELPLNLEVFFPEELLRLK